MFHSCFGFGHNRVWSVNNVICKLALERGRAPRLLILALIPLYV